MEYEIFAPDPDDEFYDELCEDAWARMWSEGHEIENFDDASVWYG